MAMTKEPEQPEQTAIFILEITFSGGETLTVATLTFDAEANIDGIQSVNYKFVNYGGIKVPLFINWSQVIYIKNIQTDYINGIVE